MAAGSSGALAPALAALGEGRGHPGEGAGGEGGPGLSLGTCGFTLVALH